MSTQSSKKTKGFFLILAPFLLIALMGFSTLIVDLGMVRVSRAQLQIATDSAALAAVNAIRNGNSAAITAGLTIANANKLLGNNPPKNVNVQLGTWDNINKIFVATTVNPNAVRVTANADPPLFFIRFFSGNKYTISTTSIAALVGGPRDIVFIVDLSPSMDLYSHFGSYPLQSVATIITNLQAVYNKLGLPQLGKLSWTPVTLIGNNNAILNSLNLTNVAYPYPAGSWTEYISYVKSNLNVSAAGYANKYGYATFVSYLLSQEPQHSQTPTLYLTPEQPLQFVKNNVGTFLTNSVTNNDKVALVTYNRTNGNTAVLEQPLTTSFSAVSNILNQRQAAHYANGSNILSAISAAVTELNTDGRPGAQWVIYILTAASFTNNGYQAIINQAQRAQNDNITINTDTITVGNTGNISLIHQLSQITGGSNGSITSQPTTTSSSLGNIATVYGTAELVN